MDNNILIVAQVIVKLFVETEKRLPGDDNDMDRMVTAILKTYKAGLSAQNQINQL